MLIMAAVVVIAPFVLMLVFNGGDRSDSRGRRVSRTWRARRQQT